MVVFSSVTSPLPNRCSRTLASRAKPAAPLGPGLLMCLPSCAACHRTPLPVRQDAPASCMRYHTSPLSTSTMVSVCSRSHTLTHTHTHLTHSTRQQVDTSRNGVPAGAGAHDMQCRLASHVTYCSTYTTREPSTAPDCTGSNAKEHARWDLTSETAHHITSISRPLCSGHVMPTRLRTYEELCHALFPEVKSTNIEIENRHAVDASLSLPKISRAQPGR